MFIFAAAVQGAATRYRGGETGGVGGGGVLQARGLWPRASKTKGAGACHLAGPRPFVRALRARRPPVGPMGALRRRGSWNPLGSPEYRQVSLPVRV